MRKNPLLVKLGQNIRSRRETLNWSQEELAMKAELDRTYIGGIERGERNVAVLNLCRIAHALGVSPSGLLEGITYKSHGQRQK